MASEVGSEKVIELKNKLQQMYINAESLLINQETHVAFHEFLPMLNKQYETLMDACKSFIDNEIITGTDWCKSDLIKTKQEFDSQVITELTKSLSLSHVPDDRRSLGSSSSNTSRSSRSSVRSEKRKSKVKLKVASIAVKHELDRVYESKQRARDKAIKLKQEAEEKAERMQQEAEEKAERMQRDSEEKAERMRLEAEKIAEAACKKALEAADRELQEFEENVEKSLQKKRREYELARAEAEAWYDEEELEQDIAKAVTQSISNGGVANTSHSTQIRRVAPTTKEQSVPKSSECNPVMTTSLVSSTCTTNVTYTTPSFLHNRQERLYSSSVPPLEPVDGSFDYGIFGHRKATSIPVFKSTNAAHISAFDCENKVLTPTSIATVPKDPCQKSGNKRNDLTQPSQKLVESCLRRDRPAPAVVLQRFNGDPMNYWLFVRQFEAHVLGKVEDYELLPLLHQHCEPNVQLKISYLSNLSPEVGFKKAWDILYEEYGRSHEIARCCEERLRSAPKVTEDNRDSLKSLANLLEKCCIAVKNIEQSSSLDSMHMMMCVINKLPMDLKKSWIECSVQIERRSGRRAKFSQLSTFLTERSNLMNSIFGREVYPARVKQSRKESSYLSTDNSTKLSVTKIVKCHYCKKDHKLSVCESFSKLSFEGRHAFVKTEGLCYKCLAGKHAARECKSREKCKVSGCTGTYHHTLLHQYPKSKESKSSTSETSSCSAVRSLHSTYRSNNSVYLNVVPVRVQYLDKFVEVYAFLDQGSTTCFCETAVADKLKAVGEKRQLTLHTLTSPRLLDTVSLQLSVQSVNGGEWLDLPDVVVVDDIPVKPNVMPSSQVLSKYRHLSNLDFSQLENNSVQLLIGANVPKAFRVEDIRTAPDSCSPDAIRSPLGWSLLGPSFTDCSFATNVCANFISARYQALPISNASSYESQFLTSGSEFCDCKHDELNSSLEEVCGSKCISVEDYRVFTLLKSSVQLTDGHYELPLPWRDDGLMMPNNKGMALKRLMPLKRRFKRDPKLKEKYTEQMNVMLEKGYAEIVNESENIACNPKTWYIPHHTVLNPNKPNKLRIVFDCAAEYKGCR